MTRFRSDKRKAVERPPSNLQQVYAVLRVRNHKNTAPWYSWLVRRPVTAEVEGSSPFGVVLINCRLYGVLAQLGEHLPYKQGVTGSSPVRPTFTPMWLNWQSS